MRNVETSDRENGEETLELHFKSHEIQELQKKHGWVKKNKIK